MEIENLQQGLRIIKECKNKFKELALYYTSELSEIENSINTILNRKTCPHSNTKIEHSYDSHYDYEDLICVDCGQELKSTKI